jgi:hypothetical protein
MGAAHPGICDAEQFVEAPAETNLSANEARLRGLIGNSRRWISFSVATNSIRQAPTVTKQVARGAFAERGRHLRKTSQVSRLRLDSLGVTG